MKLTVNSDNNRIKIVDMTEHLHNPDPLDFPGKKHEIDPVPLQPDKNAMNGLKTLDAIKTHDSSIPVIIMSSQDSIEVAVNCLHHEAFDYVVKSETAFIRLRKTISSILLYRKMEQELKKFGDKV